MKTEQDLFESIEKLEVTADSVLVIRADRSGLSASQAQTLLQKLATRVNPHSTVMIVPLEWKFENMPREQFHRMLRSYNRRRRSKKNEEPRTDSNGNKQDQSNPG